MVKHGSLTRAGKVKGQTPKVAASEKSKKKTGRAKKRLQYNRRFVNSIVGNKQGAGSSGGIG
jgi:small subunit ribosomal protein S30e